MDLIFLLKEIIAFTFKLQLKIEGRDREGKDRGKY
jgi:hypothetical protein